MTTVYITLREGKNRLIVDGSWQLFGRLLETMSTQSKPFALSTDGREVKGDNHPPDTCPAPKVQRVNAG